MAMEKGIFRKRAERQPRRCVALALDWQGDGGRDLTLLTAGASPDMLRRTMDFLSGGGRGLCEGYDIEHQHTPRYRNGYVYDRWAVVMHGYREQYAGIADMLMLVASRLEQELNGGTVDIYDIDDFLNLADRAPDRILSPTAAADPALQAERDQKTNRRSWDRQRRLGILPKGDPEE